MRKTVLIVLGGFLWALSLVVPASGQWLDKERGWAERDAQGHPTGTVEPSGRGGYVDRARPALVAPSSGGMPRAAGWVLSSSFR